MRARNIKPDFFLNEKLAEVSAYERLLFIGLWCLADREGKLEDRPKRIRAAVFPYEDVDVNSMLDSLGRAGFLIRYEADRQNYIIIPGFSKHQQPHYKEAASVIPAPQDGPSPALAAARIAPSLTDDPSMIDRSLTDDPSMIDRFLTDDRSMIDRSLTDDQSMIDRSLTDDRSMKVLDDPLIPDSLIVDSLIPDSPSLIPDSLIADSLIPDSLIADSLIPIRLLTSSAKPAAEDYGMDSFHLTKQTANPESQTNRHESSTKNPKAQTKNSGTQTNRHESPNPCVSAPNEDSIEEEPTDPPYPPEFEQFWQQYPIQTEKKQAFRLWRARIKDKVDARDLIRAAQHYAAFCRLRRTEAVYIKHPSTFLGPLKVFKDWIEPTQKGRGNGDGRRTDDEEDLNRYSI